MQHIVAFTILGLSSVALAGVGVLTPTEEQDVLAVWEKYCSDLKSESAQMGDTRVYCKNSPDVVRETLNHQLTVPGSSFGDQIVFVRPPPVVYKHNVQIEGGDASGQKTKIYVLPQKSEHEINSQSNTESSAPQKPTVYFLKSDGQ